MNVCQDLPMSIKAKLAKSVESDLLPGEQVVATGFCQMKGTMAATALGGVAGVLIAQKSGRGKRDEAVAAGFPLAQTMMLVVTDRRLFVRSHKDTLGTLAAADLAGATVVKKNALSPWTVRIDLTNGHQVTLEANARMKPGEMVEAIDHLARSVSRS